LKKDSVTLSKKRPRTVKKPEEMTLDEMEKLYQQAKKYERK
jgi:hypothetical protein